MLNTTRWLALCAAVFATGCADPPPPAAPMVAPMDRRLGTPLHSRQVPLRLSQLTGPHTTLAACLNDPEAYNTCLHQIILCDRGLLSFVYTDILYYGTYTLSGSSLHATLQGGSGEPEVPASFAGTLAEDGSFISAQLSGGRPFQNYERSAAEQKSSKKTAKYVTWAGKLTAAGPGAATASSQRLPYAT